MADFGGFDPKDFDRDWKGVRPSDWDWSVAGGRSKGSRGGVDSGALAGVDAGGWAGRTQGLGEAGENSGPVFSLLWPS